MEAKIDANVLPYLWGFLFADAQATLTIGSTVFSRGPGGVSLTPRETYGSYAWSWSADTTANGWHQHWNNSGHNGGPVPRGVYDPAGAWAWAYIGVSYVGADVNIAPTAPAWGSNIMTATITGDVWAWSPWAGSQRIINPRTWTFTAVP